MDKTTQAEEWKDVPGYEGFYQVSNIGRVRSVDHYVKHFRGDKLRKGKIKEFSITHDGYYRVGLSKYSKQKHVTVHRLVALAFIAKPESKDFVNHKDGIKTNNHVSNLEWCTSGENTRHFHEVLGGPTRKICKPVKCIEDNLTFQSIGDAAKYYKVVKTTITNWANKKGAYKTIIYL